LLANDLGMAEGKLMI